MSPIMLVIMTWLLITPPLLLKHVILSSHASVIDRVISKHQNPSIFMKNLIHFLSIQMTPDRAHFNPFFSHPESLAPLASWEHSHCIFQSNPPSAFWGSVPYLPETFSCLIWIFASGNWWSPSFGGILNTGSAFSSHWPFSGRIFVSSLYKLLKELSTLFCSEDWGLHLPISNHQPFYISSPTFTPFSPTL